MSVSKNYFCTLSFSLLKFVELSTSSSSDIQQVMKFLLSYLLLLCKHPQDNRLFVDCVSMMTFCLC